MPYTFCKFLFEISLHLYKKTYCYLYTNSVKVRESVSNKKLLCYVISWYNGTKDYTACNGIQAEIISKYDTLPKVMRVFKDNVSTKTLLASTAKKAITM